jgi:CRP/FNR family transcriptional regulator, anaerobic regulatory protein
MLTGFMNYVGGIIPLSTELKDRLESDLQIVEIGKQDIILKDRQRCDHISFVLKGLLRTYYLKDNEEICSRFVSENHVCVSIISFFTRKPGNEYIQALEPTILARIHFDALERIYRDFPEFNIVSRKWTEHYCCMSEQRQSLLRRQSAEERYRSFLELYPDLTQRIALKYIATFLGMNTETLSRIRKKWSSPVG